MLSAILYLGNVTYSQKSSGREEGLDVGPPEVLSTLSDLLKASVLFKLYLRDAIFLSFFFLYKFFFVFFSHFNADCFF